jgi:DNA uptake protein ComE-like DNA-binding protein
MATPSEKRALIFLAAIAALGITVRAVRSGGSSARADSDALDRQIASVDSASAMRGMRGAGRAKAKGRRGSEDSSTADAPRRPIREVRGGDLAAQAPDPLALYEARRKSVAESNAEAGRRVADQAAERAALIGPPQPGEARAEKTVRASQAGVLVDMDTADETAIATVPGIGPSLAVRIVADRARRGAFGSLQSLQRVSGVGPGLSSRIALYVTFSRPAMAPPTVIRLRKSRP